MSQSVKFKDDTFIHDAAAAAVLHERTLDAQILHWARIGKAAEAQPGFDLEKLTASLPDAKDAHQSSQTSETDLQDAMEEQMAAPGHDEMAFHRTRAKHA